MNVLLARLVEENRKRHPTFAPAPEPAERIAAAAAWLRVPLPDDYRAFLSEVGRVSWPMEIGHVLDFKAKDWPPAFHPFARDGDSAYGFLLAPRRVELVDLVHDLRSRAAMLDDDLEEAREEGTIDEDAIEEIEAEAEALRREADEIDEDNAARAAKPKTLDLRIDTVSLEARELPGLDPDDEDEVLPFRFWLEHAIDDALLTEKMEAARRDAPPVEEPARETEEQAAVRRALDLVDRLVAAGHLEVAPDFDDVACAAALAPVLGDAERILEVLLVVPGVEEVFASEDEVESLLASLED
jgi:hypothetical protein